LSTLSIYIYIYTHNRMHSVKIKKYLYTCITQINFILKKCIAVKNIVFWDVVPCGLRVAP
jgi:hypothetical protein